jgi:acyl carrier protein
MVASDDLKNLFDSVLDEFNSQVEKEKRLEKNYDGALFGYGGVLDSLGLVNLITLIEETIEDELDVTITLADDKAMSRKTSPFRTLNHLLEYVGELLEAH